MQLSHAQEISINSSQCFHELWRCNSIALLEKSLWMIVYIFMNFENAIESMLFHELSRDKTSSYNNVWHDHEFNAKTRYWRSSWKKCLETWNI